MLWMVLAVFGTWESSWTGDSGSENFSVDKFPCVDWPYLPNTLSGSKKKGISFQIKF